jgi:hypothetical protein
VLAGQVAGQLLRARSRGLAEKAVMFVDAAYHDRRGGDESTAVKWWRRWCAACGCAPVMRATPLQGLKAQREIESCLMMFATWLLVERKVAVATVSGYVSTVMAWHKRRHGDMLPGYEVVRLRAALKGMRCLSGREVLQQEPVAPMELGAMLDEAVDWGDADCLSLCAAVACGFCGLLRISEYCETARRKFDGRVLPTVGDLVLNGGEGEFRVLPRKKRGKVRRKEYVVRVRDGRFLRPAAMLQWMAVLRKRRGTWRSSDPLFMVGKAPMSEAMVNGFLASMCRAAGRDVFRSHLLRVSGATAALAAGVSAEQIRLMGRWDSKAYALYCRMSREAAARLSGQVASAEVSW